MTTKKERQKICNLTYGSIKQQQKKLILTTDLLSMKRLTFKELRKIVTPLKYSQEQQQTTLFSNIILNKPFWIWNIKEHKAADILTNGYCCFNHIIGLPKKNEEDKPFYDYEKLLFDTLQQHKHGWIKKATGLGITEFMLRYMAWLCLKDDRLSNSQMSIVTGPRIELAITLINRMKRLFDRLQLSFDTKETVIELNGVHIEAYPSHHLDSMRGLKDVSFILLDEPIQWLEEKLVSINEEFSRKIGLR